MGIYRRNHIQCGGITQERNLIVDGLETVPDSGLAQDAEFDLCGKIGGANTTATSCNMNMMLQYYNGTAFQGIPYGFNFGGIQEKRSPI